MFYENWENFSKYQKQIGFHTMNCFPEQRENIDIIRTIKKCTMVRNQKSYQRAVEKKIIVFCLEYILEACTLS